LPTDKSSARRRLLTVGPEVIPQKKNFSSHIFKNATCSLSSTAGDVLAKVAIYLVLLEISEILASFFLEAKNHEG
jgi:hypothetical protein